METLTKSDYAGVLKKMNGAIRVLEMYPPDHPAILLATKKPFSALQDIFKGVDHLTISKAEDRIIVNGTNIEGASLPERLLEEFKNDNINSININKSVGQDELSSFLSFFVKLLDKDAPYKSLPEFLNENDIQSISVDQLHYELVSENEVVVKTEVLEGAELKIQISKIIRDNPDLVRDILLNKSIKKDEVLGKFDPETDLSQVSDQIKNQVKDLSDDDLLHLLASGLEKNLTKLEPHDSGSALNEIVDLVYKMLEDREEIKLLPQIKNVLTDHGIVEKKHLDFIFDERWLKSQEVLDELVRMIEKLGTDEVELERFKFLWNRVINSKDIEIKTYAVDMLLVQLGSENSVAQILAANVLKEGLNQFIQEKSEVEFNHIRLRLSEKIKDPLLSAYVLKSYAELLKVIFTERINRGEFKDTLLLLVEYNNRLSSGKVYPEGVKDVALSFIQDITDEQTLSFLTSYIKEGVPMQSIKQVEEILESLDKDRVAEKLLAIFTLPDRATRMSALRVLNRLGRSSVSAISSFVSNEATFVREKESEHLVSDSWYKMRNAIYVLGNIPDDKSVQVLSRLSADPDVRVRLEVVKVLEKLNRSETVNILLSFLNDPEDEVRRSAIASLGLLNAERCLNPLLEHFRRNSKDRLSTLSAIGKIGGEETIEDEYYDRIIKFLLSILSDEEAGIKQLLPKQKDEIQIMALNILGKIGSSEYGGEIEEFIKNKKKGLKRFLTNDRLIESAHRALKMIKSKGTHQFPNGQNSMVLDREKVS